TTRNFRLSDLMEGWEIGLPKIKAGGEMTLYIPSPLAYGENVRAGIPANSIIIFDIKLVDLADNQADFDEKKIIEYLAENNLTAERHESGLHYIIEEPGEEEKPTPNSEVLVLYKGYLLDGTVFDETIEDDARQFNLNGLITGWRVGIPFIGSGGKITLFIPSSLGYGGSARPSIPANSVLIFEIELKNFQ
ncbi:MAG: FKBP-type peptidyl-prolyl cis-trans isomerase, partial [Saprospiraceae bacterium]